jgi:hypothetical protein
MSEHVENNRAFVLEIQGIEPVKSRRKSWGRPAVKRAPLFRQNVDVQITIVDHSTGHEVKKLPSTQVPMVSTHTENGKKVSLAMPTCTVKLEDLLRVPRSSWRKEPPKDWDLLVSIYLEDTSHAREFYEHMAPSDSRLLADPPSRLRTTWHNIRDCPKGVSVQPLSSDDVQLKLGLAVKMSWTSATAESILAGHNRQINKFQYSSPPLQSSGEKKYELTLIYPGPPEKRLTRYDLRCPHDNCSGRSGFALPDDLFMHMSDWHVLLKYTPKKQKVLDGVEYWTIEIETADHKAEQQRASNAAPDPRDIQIIAPSKPFNQRKYLAEGNDEFRKTARREKKNTSASRAVQAAPKATISPRHPNDVQDRTHPELRTYQVPKAPPDVTFFRSISKRPLQEGEYISESDDEVEMEWIQLKKEAQLDTDQNIPEPSKRLVRIFDRHMSDERLADDYHVGDALVRFVRTKSLLLWEDATAVDEFKAKIDELLQDNIISNDVHSACIRLVDEQNPATTSTQARVPLSAALNTLNESSPRKKKGKGKGKARVLSETGQITPQTADGDGDIEMRDATVAPLESTDKPASHLNRCLCGEHALTSRNRPFVVCESVVSIIRTSTLKILANLNRYATVTRSTSTVS